MQVRLISIHLFYKYLIFQVKINFSDRQGYFYSPPLPWLGDKKVSTLKEKDYSYLNKFFPLRVATHYKRMQNKNGRIASPESVPFTLINEEAHGRFLHVFV